MMGNTKFINDILKTLVEDGGYDSPMDYLYYLTSSTYKLQDDWNEILSSALRNMNYPEYMIINKYEDLKLLFKNSIEYYENKLEQILFGINKDSYFRYFYKLACEYYNIHMVIYCFLYEQEGKQYGSFSLNNIELSVLDKALIENVIFKGIGEIEGYREKLITRLVIDGYIVQYALYYTKYCNFNDGNPILKEDMETIFLLLNSIVLLCTADQAISNNFGNLKQKISIDNYMVDTTEFRDKWHISVDDSFLEAQEARISYNSEICYEMESNFKSIFGFDLNEFAYFINVIDNMQLKINNIKTIETFEKLDVPMEIIHRIVNYISQPVFEYSIEDIKCKFERNHFRLIYKPLPIMESGEILVPTKALLYCTYNRIQRDIIHNLIKEVEGKNGEYHNKITNELVDRIYKILNNNFKCKRNYYISNCGEELKQREIDVLCLKNNTLYLIECKDVDASFEPLGMFNDSRELKKYIKILNEKVLSVEKHKENYCNLFQHEIEIVKGIVVYREYNGKLPQESEIKIFTERQLLNFLIEK